MEYKKIDGETLSATSTRVITKEELLQRKKEAEIKAEEANEELQSIDDILKVLK